MKALTVCQPYPYLIALPDEHPEAKRVENRRWATTYRGPLLIHAGKSIAWLDTHPAGRRKDLVYSAVLVLVDLVGCVEFNRLPDRYRGHKHAFGPFCWLLANVRPLPRPIAAMGSQGLWTPDSRVVNEVVSQLEVMSGGLTRDGIHNEGSTGAARPARAAAGTPRGAQESGL